MFYCVLCREWHFGKPNLHHSKKWAVFHENDTVEVCRYAHDAIEELIRIKENAILHAHPEIYEMALREMSGNKKLIKKMIAHIDERRKIRKVKMRR